MAGSASLHSVLDGITNSVDMGLSITREMVKDREAWLAVVHGVAELYKILQNLILEHFHNLEKKPHAL